jgi:hypothetical protein
MHAHPLHSLVVQRLCGACEKKNKKVDLKLLEVRSAIRGLRESVERIQNGGEESGHIEERGRSLKRRGSE